MLTVTAGADGAAWDAFVGGHPAATVAHRRGWGDVFTAAYGHCALPLVARDGGEVVGVLPLVLIESRLFGRRLVSLPFLDYGGVLAEAGRGPGAAAVESALVEAALALARERRAHSLGLRQLAKTTLPHPVADDRVTMLLPLTTEAAAWAALPSERRNRIRKGQRQGLEATWHGASALDDFYAVFARNMRDLGSPVHGRAFFRHLLARLPDVARVLLVRDRDGRVVGAAVCLFHRETVMVPWVSSRRDAFALCPNFVLYWEVVRLACREGYRTLDLGRSFRNRGTFEFKRQWGARPHPLPWIFLDLQPGTAPSVDQDAGRYGRLVEAWKRLPLPVASALGPWIRRQVPN
jgi:FemAB-related protein (PEP-CTERM system-associated)